MYKINSDTTNNASLNYVTCFDVKCGDHSEPRSYCTYSMSTVLVHKLV